MQALYLLALEPIAETTADPNSYGFRRERSTADAIEGCFKALAKRCSATWILEGDIKACFDEIGHVWLLANIPIEKAILRKWLKAGYMERGQFHETQAGTPQGGIISPVLANMALDGLGKRLRERFPKSQRAKVNYVRFADDFIVTGEPRKLLEEQVMPVVEDFMRERELKLSREKTHITHIETGFDFLGQNVRKYQGKLLIKPSKKNVKTFLSKIRSFIKANATAPAGQLIAQLNPMIRGWANYHRHAVSKRTFTKVDDAIYRALRRWMQRRHPNKSRSWAAQKYFKIVEKDNWVFYGEVGGREYHLFKTARTRIKRHVKVRQQANPFDPAWETYFEKRLDRKMADNHHGRRQLYYLWKQQDGECPACSEKITELTGWHNHHIIWRSKGGTDTADNRVLLHPNCHRQVHSQGLYIEKPRP